MVKAILGVSMLALVMITTGCAVSPQKVPLVAPQSLTVPLAADRAIDLRVVDQRDSQTLGSRGGTYQKTALISLANNLESVVYSAAQEAFESAGYRLSTDSPHLEYQIMINDMSYERKKVNFFKHEVTVKMTALIRVSIGDYILTRTLSPYQSWERVTQASELDNQKYINEVFQTLMTNIINDREISQFMAQHLR